MPGRRSPLPCTEPSVRWAALKRTAWSVPTHLPVSITADPCELLSPPADRNVSAGTLEVWVDYLGFHVYSRKGDLCHSLAVECPLAAGAGPSRYRGRASVPARPCQQGEACQVPAHAQLLTHV